MGIRAATVIVPTLGGERLQRMLESLAAQTVAHQTIVVDNGSPAGAVALPDRLERAEVLRLERNAGYTRAVNLGVQRADGSAVVLLNDDCIVEPQFVERICAALDPSAGLAMAAGVMRDWRDRSLIDSAGMELDPTLLVFDYLNGEPLTVLERPVDDPVGPSGAAAAFDRDTFLSAGGFDEDLFAYWEDVDLVLRLHRLGFRCALAPGAIGDHEHSATLGSGSARKNYLMGFGRGYVLRKWRVLSPARVGPVLAREGALCAGQALIDHNVAGLRGRVRGYRSAEPSEPYPRDLPMADSPGALATLRRRARRRARMRSRGSPAEGGSLDTLAVFHLADSSGPSRSLEAEMRWLGTTGRLTVVVPGAGTTAVALAGVAEVLVRSYEPLTMPTGGARGSLAAGLRLAADVRMFRGEIRRHRPRLVVQVTTMLPAVALAARLERVPLLVYCGELFSRGGARGAAARALLALTAREANRVIACSSAVAAQFGDHPSVDLVYPPIADQSSGDGRRLRERYGIPADVPLVAAVGALTEGRGQDLLVAAMSEVLGPHPAARCLIVGEAFPRPQDVAYRDRLAAQVAALGLSDVVVLAGRVERIADVYVAADVIVNPARASESFGRVAFEAATARTPAVVTRVGANEELLEHGVSALTVAPDDRGAIAAAVDRLLSDPGLGAALAAGAREIVGEQLGPEQSLARFRRAVEATLAGTGRAGPG